MSRAEAELPPKAMPGKRYDSRALAAMVFDRHGFKLGENDASFSIVTLNELVLRKARAELLDQMDQHNKAALAAFQFNARFKGWKGTQAMCWRINVLAYQVRNSANG
jgi:hypothetical protein